MPKKQSRRRLPVVLDSVVSIKDFADAKKSTNKPKKALSNRVLTAGEADVDHPHPAVQQRRPVLRRSCKKLHEHHVYNDYIVDIWHLIAEYIRPEDVGNFALICKKTLCVIISGRFWRSFYKRFYTKEIELPEELQPAAMSRLRNLRANVICLLFYTYPPFIERTKTVPDLSILYDLHFSCCSYNVEPTTWVYCFKFSNRIRTRKPRVVPSIENTEDDERLDQIISSLNNIYDNPDEGLRSLVIIVDRYVPIPTHILNWSMVLRSARRMLTTDMRKYDLVLKFSHETEPTNITTVVYPSIVNYKVFNWWDPGFRIYK